MSYGSTEGLKEDTELQVTAAKQAPNFAAADEEANRRQDSEKAREASLAAKAAQANQREVAGLLERNHAYIEHAVEMAKINAKNRAEREGICIPVDPDGKRKRRNPFVMERKAAAKVMVGLVIAFILLVIGLLVGGIYFVFTHLV